MPGAADTILGLLLTLSAQPRGGRSSSTDVLLWVGVLIVVTLAGAILILAIRRRTLAGPRTPDAGSLMDELRAMRDRGQMTPQEYDAAMSAMKARLRDQVRGGGDASVKPRRLAPPESGRGPNNAPESPQPPTG